MTQDIAYIYMCIDMRISTAFRGSLFFAWIVCDVFIQWANLCCGILPNGPIH